MAIAAVLLESVGEWIGHSTLNLPWLEEGNRLHRSESKLLVEVDRHSKFATVSYTWTYDGEDHEGRMVFCQNSKQATGGWSDSWHQNSSVLFMTGAARDDISIQAVYSAEQWSWRLEMRRDGEQLILRMINIDPEGKEEWAVEAAYARSS